MDPRCARRSRLRSQTASLFVATATLLVSGLARATDPFEVQVYDGTANAPGAPGLELHLNYVAIGSNVPPVSPELSLRHQAHATFEPSIGLLPWWELGGYLQTALRPDGEFDYAGVKLRSKFVTPPGWRKRWRLGINVELSLLPSTYDHDRWGNELRPIVAYEDDSWMAAVNPIIDTALAGSDFRSGPSFQPALMLLRKLDAVSFGIEYYANLGPFSGFVPWKDEEQYVYEVANLLSIPHFELNAGIGEGLSSASSALVGKMILGYVWERDTPPGRCTCAPRLPGHF